MTVPRIRAEEFKAWLDASIVGDPKEARTFCERTMNPNFLRFAAGADRTDFERAVEKVASFRSSPVTWDASLKLFSQDGNKIAARLIVDFAIGDEPVKKVELMFMAELDGQGRYERVWELVLPYGNEEQ